MGFLPNGDLIIVSSLNKNYKLIYYYSVENKPTTNTTFWKCSQIYDIELTDYYNYFFVYQTKLFSIDVYNQLIFQWNLSTMTFDMQYFIGYYIDDPTIVINKNQTLLALNTHYAFYVFSMETGTLISKYG